MFSACMGLANRSILSGVQRNNSVIACRRAMLGLAYRDSLFLLA
jgi:hypothetical protein